MSLKPVHQGVCASWSNSIHVCLASCGRTGFFHVVIFKTSCCVSFFHKLHQLLCYGLYKHALHLCLDVTLTLK